LTNTQEVDPLLLLLTQNKKLDLLSVTYCFW